MTTAEQVSGSTGNLRRNVTLRRALTVATLALAWCALWRDLSVANLLAGAVLAVAVIATGVGTAGVGGVRPVPLARLLWIILVDLVTSTIDVAKEIITPTDRTNEAIIAINLGPEARHHFLLLVVAITLTPGTAVVDADPDNGTLYLHLLHHDRHEAVADHARRLATYVDQALPTR